MGGNKNKFMSLFETNTIKIYSKQALVKNLHGGAKKPRKLKIQKKSAENLIKNTKNLFRRKKENEAIKEKTIRLFLSKKKIIRNQ